MSNKSFLMNKDLQDAPDFQIDLKSAVLLGCVLLLGIGLRFYDLGVESYWMDEMYTVVEVQQSIPEIIMSGRLDQPPAYYLPFHLWVRTFGTSEESTRSFSALAGIGSIVLIYLVGRSLFGKVVGLLGAFLMAISWFQIQYSQEARFYSFFEFATLLSFLFFNLALRGKRITHFFYYGATSILMIYSHAYGIFFLAAQNLFVILQGKKYRSVIPTWLIFQVLVLLAIVPYFYPLMFGEGGVKGAIDLNVGGIFAGLSAPSLSDLPRTFYRFIIPARHDRSWEIVFANYATAGAFLAIGALIHVIWRRKKNNWVAVTANGEVDNIQEIPDVSGKLFLVSGWLLCPILLTFILSFVIAPIYTDRYMISAAPALYLLIALGLFSIRKLVPLIVSIGTLAILVIPGLHYYYVTDVKEQWREVAVFVEENSEQEDVIVFAPIPAAGIGIEQRSFDWYYRGNLPGCSLDDNLINSHAISEALVECVSGHARFWVIISGQSENIDRFKSFFLSPTQTSLRLIKEHQFVGISVYLFELVRRD